MRYHILWFALLSLIAWPAGVEAQELYQKGPVTCTAASSHVAAMTISNLRYGFRPKPWGSADVRLTLSNGKTERYRVEGHAVALKKTLETNGVVPSYTYAGVRCRAPHRWVLGISDCTGSRESRQCNVNLKFLGEFRVSLQIYKISHAAQN